MQVCLKARDDAKSVLFSECKVLIDVAAGIDDDRLASAHVDEVRGVGERLVGDRMNVTGSHVVSSRSPSPDRVAVGPELPRLVLTAGTAEGVHDRAELHVGEAGPHHHRLPPCTRQGTGDSAGPQVDVSKGRLWDGFLHADVGYLDPPA